MRRLVLIAAMAAGVVFGAGEISMVFDGVDDRITVPSDSSLDFGTGAFSFSAWFRPTALDSGAIIRNRTGGGGGTEPGFAVEYNGAGGANKINNSSIDDGAGNSILILYTDADNTHVFTDGEWAHVAFVWTGSVWTYYADGAWVLSRTNASIGNIDTPNDYGIGNFSAGLGPLDGTILHPQIWNRALTAAEIRGLAGATNFVGQSVAIPQALSPDLDTVVDRSGEGNDGTPSGGVVWGAGSAEFDGVDDVIDCAAVTELNGATELTLSAWLDVDSITEGFRALFVKWKSSPSGDDALFFVDYDGRPYAVIYGDAAGDDKELSRVDVAMSLGWHHIAITWSGPNTLTHYIDGGEVAATRSTTGTPPSSLYASTQPLLIGNEPDGTWGLGTTASTPLIYSRAITSNEVATLYAAGRDAPTATISTTGLVLAYDFRADMENNLVLNLTGETVGNYATDSVLTNGTICIDASMSGNHGSAQGGVTIGHWR